ncbi:MAG: nicotinate phosphoribosyltransferase [Bacillota bacterium]|jgi:nicotinate phosphoribosyltransferase
MSKFNGQRLPDHVFQIDVERMRNGWYSDAYFSNTVSILQALSKEQYRFSGQSDLGESVGQGVLIGDIVVEMQFFTRRKPFTLVAGVDEALAILRSCTGYYAQDGTFVNTFDDLEVEAVEDGTFAYYDGDPKEVQPMLRVRGRYRDFAQLETPILGALTEASRIATNVYNVLQAANGKDVLFFPARFAHYKLQALHGYAYSLAVDAYNATHNRRSHALVSTNDQGGWWGGKGGGTVSHSSIACFLGDTAETMLQFARIIPPEVPRIALVDFHNDCVGDTLRVIDAMYAKFIELYRENRLTEAEAYRLYAVRPDTSGSMRDVSVSPLGDKSLDCGVNPRLVWQLRQAIDSAYLRFDGRADEMDIAQDYCRQVKIVVTGGFDAEKIKRFESLQVPADIYGVGSSLLENSSATGTNNDYTADIVRVRIDDRWYNLSKVGRKAGSNPMLQRV